MNNKGFAITTILFGTMILFCLLLVSLLGILANYKNNLEKLVDSENGARGTVTIEPNSNYANIDELKASPNKERGLYCFSNGECRYISNDMLKWIIEK